ncbi:hypothetical protein B0T18DRAFT_387434 [Schizothecium vesticola]|uniref:Uncharacterized protein n=1 Tax=Schizothecium vesticola TaxID=314040 RepID=A0AA40F5A6_9PEZI|nr:hypothetical protein B0T18DRAFT_387434 [Schizothecium vesticola]
MLEKAKTAVRSEFHFARAQLQHYGIKFSQSGFSGNGCNRVPDDILMLKMHTDWLRKCWGKHLAKAPMYYQWILEKAGTPDVLSLGWDSTAVKRAAFNHIGGEDDESESDEDSQSDIYVPRVPSAGKPFAKDHMTMTIRTTRTSGLYQARFNFDAIEGVMMLSANEALLKAFVSDARIDSGDDSDPLGKETGSRERVLERMARKRILKRKRRMAAAAGKLNGPAAKKARSSRMGRPSTYFFWVRCRDLGNYKICKVGKGTVKFNGPGGRTGVRGGSDKENNEMDDEKEEEESDSGADTGYVWDMFSG